MRFQPKGRLLSSLNGEWGTLAVKQFAYCSLIRKNPNCSLSVFDHNWKKYITKVAAAVWYRMMGSIESKLKPNFIDMIRLGNPAHCEAYRWYDNRSHHLWMHWKDRVRDYKSWSKYRTWLFANASKSWAVVLERKKVSTRLGLTTGVFGEWK